MLSALLFHITLLIQQPKYKTKKNIKRSAQNNIGLSVHIL